VSPRGSAEEAAVRAPSPEVAAKSSPAPERSFATPPYGTPAGNGSDGQQSTVLNADYLRVAREAALAQAAAQEVRSPASAGLHGSGELAAAEAAAAFGRGASAEDAAASSFRSSWAPPSSAPSGSSDNAGAPGSAAVRGFEPVPVVRAPLAESLSGGLNAVAELGGRGPARGTRPLPRPGYGPRGDAKARWMLLCAAAFAVIGVVAFGGRLLNRYRSTTERTRALAALEAADPSRGDSLAGSGVAGAGTASRALLANRPASERGLAAGRATVVSASGVPLDPAGAAPAPAPAEAVSQESQLAATAGRHMLAGNYAEALPVYRQLARSAPENTSYAAMARLLEKRVGSMNDTRTIAPATP
jgi:hypothetical protein